MLLLVAFLAGDLYEVCGQLSIAAYIMVDFVVATAFFVVVDRAVTRFGPLRPMFCSIYDRRFWGHERYWKVPAMAYLGSSTARRSRTSSGACWEWTSGARSSTTAAGAPSVPW
ncbi:hypothetical protein NKH77_01910 [Streptomyces sp. M19]